jgi:hypothetical protein
LRWKILLLCSFQIFHHTKNTTLARQMWVFAFCWRIDAFVYTSHWWCVRVLLLAYLVFQAVMSNMSTRSGWMNIPGINLWAFLVQRYIIGTSGLAAIHVWRGCWQVRILCWWRIHAKILTFRLCLCFPNRGEGQFLPSSHKLYLVSTLCGVLTIRCPFPLDLIFRVFHHVYCVHPFP